MNRPLLAAAAALALSLPLAGLQAPAGGKALVIGNAVYGSAGAAPGAAADARTVASALEAAGVRVTLAENLRLPALAQAIDAYLQTVSPGDAALVYYAGHALQLDGENYLLGVEFDPKDRRDIGFTAYSVSGLRERLEERKPRLKILVLDAARPNAALAARASGEGLAAVTEVSPGTLVLFPAQAGRLASERAAGAAGLFAESLAAALAKPGLALDDIVREVQKQVSQGSSQQQMPWAISTVTEVFYFRQPVAVEPPKPVPAAKEKARIFENPTDTLWYVWIPPGSFQMGCVPNDPDCEDEEKPRHPVTISRGFWLSRTEVTSFAYNRFAIATKRPMPKRTVVNPKWNYTDHPQTRVSWEDAKAFCEWAGGRLPTEAEWEYAARGGVDGAIYAWGNAEVTHDRANYDGKGGTDRWDDTAPVRSFEANPFGLFDMAGNVWEWVEDYFDPAYYAQAGNATDPKGPAAGKTHAMRGGSWYSAPKHLRVSARRTAEAPSNHLGVRCVRDTEP